MRSEKCPSAALRVMVKIENREVSFDCAQDGEKCPSAGLRKMVIKILMG